MEPSREIVNNLFVESLKSVEFQFPDPAIDRLVDYFLMVLATNQSINLISSKQDLETQIIVHLLDSVLPLKYFDFNDIQTVMDFGAGGGFPGIPLSLLLPEIRFTLIESTGKKANFLETVRDRLTINNLEIIKAYLEPGRNPFKRKFDVITARAVSDLKTLAQICGPRLNGGGYFLAFKGPKADEEMNKAANTLNNNGLVLAERFDFVLPVIGSSRSLILFQKKMTCFT